MLSALIAALQNADLNMAAEEIADSLWLALHMETHQQEKVDFAQDPLAPDPSRHEDLRSNQPPQPLSPEPSVTETVADVHPYPQPGLEENVSHTTGILFRSPAAAALPNALALSRALRPLMRRLPSKTMVLFNERATVQRIAETQMSLWTPVFDPAPVRWFDVELVVDTGASMSLWRETITELRMLLEHLGAFRDVRLWRLATDNKDRVDIYAGLHSNRARNPKELINPGGYRLILVVSDGISLAWHSGKVQGLLDIWGKKNFVTLIHMLPRRLWPQTALGNADIVQVSTTQPDASNRGLKMKKTLLWSDEGSPTSALPLPIVTLEAKSLSPWTHMLTDRKKTWVTGAIFEQFAADIALEDEPSNDQESADALSPQRRVQLFRTSASSMARKLAGLLAAAPIPISLPVIRQVQSTLLSEASQIHVAEVLLGGLLEEIYSDEISQDPDHVQYDFIAGVRDELMNTVPLLDAHRVLKEISQFIQERYGEPRNFLALMATPQPDPDQGMAIAPGSHPFAQIEFSALRRFGGAFVPLIDEFEQFIKQANEQQDDFNHAPESHRSIFESLQEYSTDSTSPTPSNLSFMQETWCDFTWTPWLPLNSSELPTGPGIYRVRAVKGNEIFYIGSTGRNLKKRIGDLYRNIMRDATQMPFNDPHTAAPALWAWRDATSVDFECSALALSSQENLEVLVHYFLWQYRLENGSSTLANHGRFHPNYTRSGNRSTGRRGDRLPEGSPNPAGGPSLAPLHLSGAPLSRDWMGLAWSESYSFLPANLRGVEASPGCYKILDPDNTQLLFIGISTNLRNRLQSQARKNWSCPNPLFSFAALSSDILPHQLSEIENDLIAGYYAQTKVAPTFQFASD